jgi:hypothetical protein
MKLQRARGQRLFYPRVALALVCVLLCHCDSERARSCTEKSPWGRYYCCDKPGELPGISCVDPNEPDMCISAGNVIDLRIAQTYCCDGTRTIYTYAETTDAVEGYPAGCGPGLYPPSASFCSPCGDQICDAVENRCNCPEDCDAGDAGEPSSSVETHSTATCCPAGTEHPNPSGSGCPPDLTAPIVSPDCGAALEDPAGKISSELIEANESGCPGESLDVMILLRGAAKQCTLPDCPADPEPCPLRESWLSYWEDVNDAQKTCVVGLLSELGATITSESGSLLAYVVAELSWEQIKGVAALPSVASLEPNTTPCGIVIPPP